MRRFYTFVLVGLALLVSVAWATRASQGISLSADSLKALQELNFENDIAVDPWMVRSPAVSSELLQANSFEPESALDNQGLVVRLRGPNADFVVLRPQKALNADALNGLASAYQEAIPEFETVELDQDVSLQGPVYDWTDRVEPSVQLSEETSDEPVLASEKDVVVAVIDSGIDPEHPLFEGRSIRPLVNEVNDDPSDEVGHGTHIAGIVAQNSPHAVIAPYKIVGADGGRLSNVLRAFRHATEDGADIINMSFGLYSESASLERMLEDAYKDGVVVVAAAGNNNNSFGFYPATYPESFAVAAVDADGEKMPKSNYGDWVDVAADGYLIKSSLPGGVYGFKSGTSQATALVSARVAEILWSASGDLLQDEILRQLEAERSTVPDGPLAGIAIIQ